MTDGTAIKWWETKVELGARVELKSGGFAMTIEAIDGDDVTCIWAAKDGKIHREVLKAHVLKNSTGADVTIIMEGLNASADDIADYRNATDDA